MSTMIIGDRDGLVILIVAYGDARENGHWAADADGEIEGLHDNRVSVDSLAEVVNDAYAYRLGEASSLDDPDPDTEPIDAGCATTYADLARRLGIQLNA